MLRCYRPYLREAGFASKWTGFANTGRSGRGLARYSEGPAELLVYNEMRLPG